jgi:hypothetical protein
VGGTLQPAKECEPFTGVTNIGERLTLRTAHLVNARLVAAQGTRFGARRVDAIARLDWAAVMGDDVRLVDARIVGWLTPVADEVSLPFV